MTWREIDNYTGEFGVLVLDSAYYDEDDYIRDYETSWQRRARS